MRNFTKNMVKEVMKFELDINKKWYFGAIINKYLKANPVIVPHIT